MTMEQLNSVVQRQLGILEGLGFALPADAQIKQMLAIQLLSDAIDRACDQEGKMPDGYGDKKA